MLLQPEENASQYVDLLRGCQMLRAVPVNVLVGKELMVILVYYQVC